MPNPQSLFTQKLERLVLEGALTRDPVQFAIARRFDGLIDALAQSRAEKKSNALGCCLHGARPTRRRRAAFTTSMAVSGAARPC